MGIAWTKENWQILVTVGGFADASDVTACNSYGLSVFSSIWKVSVVVEGSCFFRMLQYAISNFQRATSI